MKRVAKKKEGYYSAQQASDAISALELIKNECNAIVVRQDALLSILESSFNGDYLECLLDYLSIELNRNEKMIFTHEDEIRKIKALISDCEKLSNIKAALFTFLQNNSIDKIKGLYSEVAIHKNGGYAPLQLYTSVEDLPDKYKRVKVDINYDAIRKDMGENGYLVDSDGVLIAEEDKRGEHLKVTLFS